MPGAMTAALTLALAAALMAVTIVDLRTYRIPDWLTLPLVATGLWAAYAESPDQLQLHGLAALLGFLAFWLVAEFYRRARNIDGLGLGDAKLLAAIGAWLGPFYIAPTVLSGAVLALCAVLILRLVGHRISWQSRLPFGPFLGAAFFFFWCFGLSRWSSML